MSGDLDTTSRKRMDGASGVSDIFRRIADSDMNLLELVLVNRDELTG